MSEIVNYSEQSYKRKIKSDAKFLLVGNNIDGYVNINTIEFSDYNDMKNQLPELLIKLECRGEWTVSLFQITKEYNMLIKYGYFKKPSHGKLILEHSYMDFAIKSINFLSNKIQFVSSSLEILENWDAKSNEDFLNYNIDINILSIYIK